MTPRTAIAGVAPMCIVADVPATLACYRDMLGFEVIFRGPSPDDEFFGIVRRGGAMLLFKALGEVVDGITGSSSVASMQPRHEVGEAWCISSSCGSSFLPREPGARSVSHHAGAPGIARSPGRHVTMAKAIARASHDSEGLTHGARDWHWRRVLQEQG